MPGAHSADNDALILRGKIHQISFDVNQQITALKLAIVELEDAGTNILNLRTGDTNVMAAAGLLSNRVTSDLRATLAQLVQVRQTLETYEKRL